MAFVLVLDVEGLGPADAGAVGTAAAGNARLMAAVRDWQARHGTKPGGAVTDALRIKITVLDTDGKTFAPAEILLGQAHELPVDIAEAALRHGAVAVTAILETALSYRMNRDFGRLMLSAVATVERWMAEELAALEARASALAQTELKVMQDLNEKFRGRFRGTKFSTKKPIYKLDLPAVTKTTLFAKLAETRLHRMTMDALAPEMARRDRIDGTTPQRRAAARKRSPTRAAHYEMFAGRHRAAALALMQLDAEIFAIFPPALAILGQIDADLAGWVPHDDAPPGRAIEMLKLEQKYDALIRSALLAHDQALATIATSLASASAVGWANAYFQLSDEDRRDVGGLVGHVQARLLAEAPGAWDRLFNLATLGPLFGTLASNAKEAAALAENHVLARLPLVARMARAGLAAPQPGAETLLLSTFVRDLARAQAVLVAEESASATRWRKMELALALAGLVVGLVTLPFGAGEAILPASLGTISAITVGTLIVGSVALMARAVMDTLAEGLRNDTLLRDRLIGTGQTNPEAMEAVALFLTTRRDMARALGTAAVEALVDIAAQRLLPPLALALDLRDHYQAMDTLTEGLSDLRGAH
ncbi:MAG: hypothetical protein ING16_12110 [Roseomonas sp.]|nr:hypothetical protein [Roseomonas sp.]